MEPGKAPSAEAAEQAQTPYIISKEAQSYIDRIVQGKCLDSIIQFGVDKDTCVIAPKTALPFDACSRADRVDRVLKLAKKEGPCLFVFRVDLNSNTPEWALLAWAPAETVLYAERIFYFTALSWLSGSMVGVKPVNEFYVTKEREMPTFHWT